MLRTPPQKPIFWEFLPRVYIIHFSKVVKVSTPMAKGEAVNGFSVSLIGGYLQGVLAAIGYIGIPFTI